MQLMLQSHKSGWSTGMWYTGSLPKTIRVSPPLSIFTRGMFAINPKDLGNIPSAVPGWKISDPGIYCSFIDQGEWEMPEGQQVLVWVSFRKYRIFWPVVQYFFYFIFCKLGAGGGILGWQALLWKHGCSIIEEVPSHPFLCFTCSSSFSE